MAITWNIDTNQAIDLAALIAHLDEKGPGVFAVDLDATAAMLRRLSNNRSFLAEHVRAVMHANESFGGSNQYSSQAFMLHRSTYYSLRAVVWEPARGRVGEELFAYEFAHDHDFSFFTVGYLGPGYRTRVYEYDHDAIIGLPEEPVELRFLEDTVLSPGKVMMFRRSADVHIQLPPEAFSISVNILQNTAAWGARPRQYQFDAGAERIKARLNSDGSELLLKLGAVLGGRCLPLVAAAARSGTEVSRAVAIESLARHESREWLAVGQDDASAFVRETTRRIARELSGSPTLPRSPSG
ncbi:transposase [Sorangium sp. So ce117]|uniref:transposase n=1 Tax=Sorangium sp. So ce117 TaxID=3133277 RepID=UPI003F5D5D57